MAVKLHITCLCYWCRYRKTCKLDHLVRVIEQGELCYLYVPDVTQEQQGQQMNGKEVNMWLPLLLLALLTIWLIKYQRKDTPIDENRPRMKITITKPNEGVLGELPPSSNPNGKAIKVAEGELEEWFRKNPALREANKITLEKGGL